MYNAFFHPGLIAERAQAKQAAQDQINSARTALMEKKEKARVEKARAEAALQASLEQGAPSSATSVTSSEDSDAPPATLASEAATPEPSVNDLLGMTVQFNTRVQAILARTQASLDEADAAASAAVNRLRLAAACADLSQNRALYAQEQAELAQRQAEDAQGKAGLAQRQAEYAQGQAEHAQGQAELAQEEAANPRAKRILDFEADQASAGSQSSKASRPSLCTRSSVARS